MYHGTIPEEDVEKDAGHLGITVEEFKKLYLKRDEISGDYDTKHMPVTFFRRMEPADWENADQKAAGIIRLQISRNVCGVCTVY